MTNEIKQDTTDVSISYRLGNANSTTSNRSFIVVYMNETNDYECYLQLISWRVPVRAKSDVDAWLTTYSQSKKCSHFASKSVKVSQFYDKV